MGEYSDEAKANDTEQDDATTTTTTTTAKLQNPARKRNETKRREISDKVTLTTISLYNRGYKVHCKQKAHGFNAKNQGCQHSPDRPR